MLAEHVQPEEIDIDDLGLQTSVRFACPCCKGRGWVVAVPYIDYFEQGEKEDCPECDGEGFYSVSTGPAGEEWAMEEIPHE